MSDLHPLSACLSSALAGVDPVSPEPLPPHEARGLVLASDAHLPHDMPPRHEALRAGLAVTALDLVGAGPQNPVPLGQPETVTPGAALPEGTDAILPPEDADGHPPLLEAIRALAPGDGLRRAGHDGRAGARLIAAGARLTAGQVLAARLAGLEALPVRRPRVVLSVNAPALHGLVRSLACTAGAVVTDDAPHLRIIDGADHTPRLALNPGETAWLAQDGSSLTLTLPPRFDAALAALLALAVPALAVLTGRPPAAETRPLTGKLTSAVGVSELVLLERSGADWAAMPAGLITLTGIARADAFAILPADSEGLAAGSALQATPLDRPFG